MNILNRLYNLVRAGVFSQDTSASHSDDHTDNQATSFGNDTADRKPDVDPVLAGYYANLEVPYGSDLATVKKSWKHLLRKYHPDLHSEDPGKREIAHSLTQGLNRAYQELKRHLEKKL